MREADIQEGPLGVPLILLWVCVVLGLISQVALVVKNLLASAGNVRDKSSIRGWEDSLEKEMATHSSILAWRIPWRGAWWAVVHSVAEPGRTEAT